MTIEGTRLVWSPDGRYLAFSAAIDGPSSDLYALDIRTDELIRLSDGLNQATSLVWSPDSRGILHAELDYRGTYQPLKKALWYAPLDGPALTAFEGVTWNGGTLDFVAWLDDSRFLYWHHGVNEASGELILGNLQDGDARSVLQGAVGRAGVWGPPFAVLEYAGEVTVLVRVSGSPYADHGEYYIVDSDGMAAPIQPPLQIDILRTDEVALPRFGVFYALTEAGLIRVFPDGKWDVQAKDVNALRLNPSPSQAYLLAHTVGYASPREGTIMALDEQGAVRELQSFAVPQDVSSYTWSPDERLVLMWINRKHPAYMYVGEWRVRYSELPAPSWLGWRRGSAVYLP